MRRLNRSTEFVMLKSFACISLHWLIALCSVALLSGCGNDSSGITDGSNSAIVINPNAPPDDTASAIDQNNSNTATSNPTDTTSGNTSPLLEDEITSQQFQSAEDNASLAVTESINTNDYISPNVPDGLPPDCIFDISASNVTFCYQAKDRMLSAWQSDGHQWWTHVLPGDNTTNEIHALRVVNENLYLVTELKADSTQTGFEISMFAFDGAFIKTIALNKFQDYSFVAGHRIQLANIEDNLIITGDYGLSSNNILPNQFNGTLIAVFNTTSNLIVKSKLYPQLRQTNPMNINGDSINLELEHLVYEVSLDNLELMSPVNRFQSIPFNRSNHHQKKHRIIGFIEKPPFEALHAQMNTAFSTALRNKRQANPDAALTEPIDCAGGGTVQQSLVVDEFDSEVQTTTFDNCIMSEFSAHGVLLQRQTRSCGKDCEGLNKTLRALEFDVTFANGEHWAVDGFISIKETRNSFSEEKDPDHDPETVYANQTEINVFSMSNEQISIDLAQVQYQYDGTLKSGTSTWVGSGTVSYATGVTEIFSVDLSRKLINGIQTNFSGQVDASRTDGTALFVGVDKADQSGVRYTTTAAGESVQTTSTW